MVVQLSSDLRALEERLVTALQDAASVGSVHNLHALPDAHWRLHGLMVMAEHLSNLLQDFCHEKHPHPKLSSVGASSADRLSDTRTSGGIRGE